MSKNYRGKGIKKIEGWRGTCPKCKRTGVKLLWSDGDKKVCKKCFNTKHHNEISQKST